MKKINVIINSCPFCGSEANIDFGKKKIKLVCTKCGVKMSGYGLEGVVKEWNKRTTKWWLRIRKEPGMGRGK